MGSMNEIEPVVEVVPVARRSTPATDLDAFITVSYEEHSSSIYGLALRSTRSPDLAADITQEAFLRLFAEGQRGRFPEHVGGWLYRTSSNLIISGARRQSVARRFAPRLVRRDESAGPETIALGRERRSHIDDALASLSVPDRMVLVLAAQGATGQEIAGYLGRSDGATRTLLSRARVRLRAALDLREDPR